MFALPLKRSHYKVGDGALLGARGANDPREDIHSLAERGHNLRIAPQAKSGNGRVESHSLGALNGTTSATRSPISTQEAHARRTGREATGLTVGAVHPRCETVGDRQDSAEKKWLALADLAFSIARG